MGANRGLVSKGSKNSFERSLAQHTANHRLKLELYS